MAVPVGAVGKLAKNIIPFMKKGALLTDTGSTKASVLKDVSPYLTDDIIWRPSNPLAGTEYSGPESCLCSLFEIRYWIILTVKSEEKHVARFEKFIKRLGAVSERMEAIIMTKF